MKVLLTHQRFAPDFAGGGEYVVLETARCLMHRGIDVQVLTSGDASVREYEGIPTRRLPIHPYWLNLALLPIVRAARDVDLIQTFNYHACFPSLLAGRLLDKPVVCLMMGLFRHAWIDMRGPFLGRAMMSWERFLVRRPFARILFPSDFAAHEGFELGASKERSVVTVPGIDVGAYGPSPQKEDVVLYVGKYESRKGVYDIIAAAQDLPDVRFRLMGWGPEEATVRAQAPGNVEIVPFERGLPLREAFARARIFLFPSRAETLGIALLEAMASGCAIISTVPLEFAGVRVAPGDRSAIVAAVHDLWRDREATAAMARRNEQLAQNYTWERYTDRVLATYAEVLEEWESRTGRSR